MLTGHPRRLERQRVLQLQQLRQPCRRLQRVLPGTDGPVQRHAEELRQRDDGKDLLKHPMRKLQSGKNRFKKLKNTF